MERANLTLEGVAPDELTTEFLVAVMEAADEQDMDLRGISIRFPDESESNGSGP